MNNIKNSMDDAFLSYACDILADTNTGLSGTEIVKMCNKYAIEWNVITKVNNANSFSNFGKQVPNKRTGLLWNLQAFNKEQQFIIINDMCELERFANNDEVRQLKEKLFERYGYLPKERIGSPKTEEVKKGLEKYPLAHKQYMSAMEKYKSGKYERNMLDDIRLTLELLLKDILKNNKSLENQLSYLGDFLQKNSVSKELCNKAIKDVDYFNCYQNNHIKHNDIIEKNDIEYAIDIANSLISLVIKCDGGTNQ